MKTVRLSVSIEADLHAELSGYCVSIDRTLQNFLVHAARQYMRRYPSERQTRGKVAAGVPEANGGGKSGLRLQDCSPGTTAEGGQ